ncbi:MAG TPA: type II secretion system protein GspG, partial [Thermoleophilia bacterium]|nr:type II secretion system protein GspG [Thermoleophilia bacterium]
IVIIIIGILAAIAIPMFLNQRDKAKESAVKEGIHSIQVGVQSYAVDHNDAYPPATAVVNTLGTPPAKNVGDYVDNWPKNPWSATGAAMAREAGAGNFSYANPGTGGEGTFTLIGFGKGGTGIITVP